MKLLVALMLLLYVPAIGYPQTVSFSGGNVSLQKVFASIEQQTGLSFVYSISLIAASRPVTANFVDKPIKFLLDSLLPPRGLAYDQGGKSILVTPILVDVSGKVTNEQGEALQGASVISGNSTKGTLTNEHGDFSISQVAIGTGLVISFIGLQKEQFSIDGKPIRAFLKLPSSQLDEAQVIPYGNTTQRLSTGNIGAINAGEIARQPVDNPLLAMEGQVPGLFIVPGSGLPGTGVKVQIQGQNSISNGNNPLYLIDGVPYYAQLLATTIGGPLGGPTGPAGTSVSGNPMSYINPDDIESIAVFKDADATAIYGSRGANGVIDIRTKKGKPGNAKVTIDVRQGAGTLARWFSMMNTPQYLEMRNEALKNDRIAGPQPSDFDLNDDWDLTRNTNWQKTLLGGTAQYTNANASVSGGDSLTQYLLAGTYHRATTVFPGNFGDAKGSLYLNLGSRSANRRFSFQLMTSYSYDNNLLPQIDLTSIALGLPPDAPAIYNPDRSLNWQLTPSGASTWSNPLAYLHRTYSNRAYNLLGNLVLGYAISTGLDFKLNLGYNSLRTNEFSRNPLTGYPPGQDAGSRSVTYSNNNSGSWIVEPNLNYQWLTQIGKFILLLGFTIEQNSANGSLLNAYGFNSDAQLDDITAATTITPIGSVQTLYKYTGAFSRISYSYRDKYLVNGTIRRDGSSDFGPGNAYHNFIAVGAAWLFSEEKFVSERLPFLSHGKFRGSYGTTGNDQIGDYRYLDQYEPVSTGVPYQNAAGLALRNLANPGIQWELTKKFQTGIDLGFLNDRILLSANVVINKSSNELINVNLPIITGFSTIAANVPATVRNTALEFELNTINIRTSRFSWRTGINLTVPHNRLLRYIGTPPANFAVGQPLGILQVYDFAGVDPSTGVYQFRDSKGQVSIAPNPLTDQTKFVNTVFPSYYGGLKNTLAFGRFEITMLIQVVHQIGANERLGSFPGPGSPQVNQPTTILGRWQKPGDITTIERYNSDGTLISSFINAQQSTAGYAPANYIRVKNLSLSYRLSPERLRQLHCKSLQIYLQGENLFTVTHYAGLDPETGNVTLPPLRMLSLGMRLEL